MFNLFLAIFGLPAVMGGLYIGLSEHKEFEKDLETKREQTISNRSLWESSVTNAALERELTYQMNMTPAAFWEKYKNELCSTSSLIWGNYASTHGSELMDTSDVLRILMANRGKLTIKDAKNGVFVDYYGNIEKQNREAWNKAALVTWMDGKLKAHGVNEQLLARATTDIYIVRDKHVCDDNFGGVYLWYPMVSVEERNMIKEWRSRYNK